MSRKSEEHPRIVNRESINRYSSITRLVISELCASSFRHEMIAGIMSAGILVRRLPACDPGFQPALIIAVCAGWKPTHLNAGETPALVSAGARCGNALLINRPL